MTDEEKHAKFLMNDRRQWAEAAVRAYLQSKGDATSSPLEETDLSDLLADLHHLADGLGFDCNDMVENAMLHYEGEVMDGKN